MCECIILCVCKSVCSLQVSRDRGEQLAIEYGIKFMETSAKASINVEEAFFTLARDIKAKMEKKLVCGGENEASGDGWEWGSGCRGKQAWERLGKGWREDKKHG